MKNMETKLHGYAKGGMIHSDAAEDKKLIKAEIGKAMKEDEAKDKKMFVEKSEDKGMKRLDKSPRGYKKGGKVKAKKPAVKINIVNAPMNKDSKDGIPDVVAARPAAAPPVPSVPMSRPPVAPVAAPNAAMRPVPTMQKCGGRTK